jgi:hypothetical protein
MQADLHSLQQTAFQRQREFSGIRGLDQVTAYRRQVTGE